MKIRYVRKLRFNVSNKLDALNVETVREPIACLVGGYIDGEPFVACSTCHKNDQFSKARGRHIAIERFKRKIGVAGINVGEHNVHLPRRNKKLIENEIEQFYVSLTKKAPQHV